MSTTLGDSFEKRKLVSIDSHHSGKEQHDQSPRTKSDAAQCIHTGGGAGAALHPAAQLHLSDISREWLHTLPSSTSFIQGLLLSLSKLSDTFIKKLRKVMMTIQPFPPVTSVPKQVLRRKKEEQEGNFPA